MNNTATALQNPVGHGALGLAPDETRGRFSTDDPGSTPGMGGRCEQQVSKTNEVQERPIKKVLVATDFSPSSQKAVDRAVAITNQCGAVLTVLHVVDVNAQAKPGESGTADHLRRRLWGLASSQMGRLAWSLCGRVEAQTMVHEGLPGEEIVEKSRSHDLVVLGKSRARRGWNLFSPHTGRHVIENAACPVMVVRDRE